ncbi:hypothetical protein [Bacteroides acidifaciens]|uniref:hypothetical protein n=1 Tax=Bacteroides acidifaciens TaxID=85831 RepID=UPI0025A9D02D|nr:hypothetical protein [Bacteroides acidifaciens]
METNDILGAVFDKTKDLLILFIGVVLDCIESAFDCMTYRKGKNLLPVLLVVVSFLPISLLSEILELGFIHWQDALVASIFMTIIYAINNITKAQVENSIIFAREEASVIKEKVKRKVGKNHAEQ